LKRSLITSLLLLPLCVASMPMLSEGQQASRPSPVNKESEGLLAPTPPMGWNSWDSFGTTVTEEDVRANAAWLSHYLKPHGWQYVVVDMEWFVTNPTPEGNSKNSQYSMDKYGRYIPDDRRFPSAANNAGFRPLADYIHSLGLKFGIHILRGIPKGAVADNLPIADSPYRAADAADRTDLCPWNPDNYGTDSSKSAAQAYYDSIAELYASWNVDFVKADCIASHPYKGDDIRMLSLALHKTGRPIVLSLSPGEAPIEKLEELRRYSQMWRISDDVWDLWHSLVPYPQGVNDQFSRAGKWSSTQRQGAWPDADMLPLGYLGPRPGWGKDGRQSRLTHEEQKTLFTLWCMFRSPLMMGGNLTDTDPWTLSLLTNTELLAIDQHSTGNHVAISTVDVAVWIAQNPDTKAWYVAIFNRGETLRDIRYDWKNFGLPAKEYKLRDLWGHRDLGRARSMAVRIAPHGCIVYRLNFER